MRKRQPKDRPPAAVVYCRVSTDAQERDGTSLDSQEAACVRYAEEQGWPVVAVIRDTASRATLDRPGLTRVRDMMREGEVAIVLSYAVDRMSSNQDHMGVLFYEASETGVRLDFVTEQFEDTLIGRFILTTRTLVAGIEREKIRERTIRGKKGALRLGHHLGMGAELYGYHNDRINKRRAVNEPEAAVVRQIAAWLVEDGMSVRAIAARLDAQGVPTPGVSGNRGRAPVVKCWAVSTITRMLRREDYKGVQYSWRFRRDKAGGPREHPREEWIALPEGTTPAILSPDLWQLVQVRLDRSRGEYHRNLDPNNRRLLRGMVRCAECGGKMQPNRAVRDNGARVYVYYQCVRPNTPGALRCAGKAVHAEALEAFAREKVAEALQNPATIAAELEREDDPAVDDAERLRLRRSVALLDRQRDNIMAAMREADAPDLREELRRQYNAIATDRQRVAGELQRIEARAEARRTAHQRIEGLYAYCERVRDRLATFGWEDWRRAMEALQVEVTAAGRGGWVLRGSLPVEQLGVDLQTSPRR